MPRYDYAIHRLTYDKLPDALIALGEQGYRVSAHFVGGRDWVLISEHVRTEAVA